MLYLKEKIIYYLVTPQNNKKNQQPAILKHLFCKREREKGSETLNRQRKAVMCCSSSNLKERT